MLFQKGHKLIGNNKGSLGKHWKTKPRTIEQRKKYSEMKKGKKFSEKHRRSLSNSHKERVKLGLNNLWKGGITEINSTIRDSLEYKLWREAVFKRDNYWCVWGGKEHGDDIEADHIQKFSEYPELRFAIDNGRTLCKSCHRKRHKNEFNQENQKFMEDVST